MKTSNVYKDYFTNIAVAWFTAGIIAPFVTPELNSGGVFTSILSAIMSLGFLSFAKTLENKK